MVYAKKFSDELPKLYHLIFQKNYLKDKNTQESTSTVIYLYKIINIF